MRADNGRLCSRVDFEVKRRESTTSRRRNDVKEEEEEGGGGVGGPASQARIPGTKEEFPLISQLCQKKKEEEGTRHTFLAPAECGFLRRMGHHALC